MSRIAIQQAAFDLNAEVTRLSENNPDIGAIASFIGQVRGKDIASLTLEYYPGMTEQALKRIADQAREHWQLQAVTIIHRVGELVQGEQIVLVLTAAAHRHAAFAACEFVMDTLKTQAPFWKKERLQDGSEHWVAARDTDTQAALKWLIADG